MKLQFANQTQVEQQVRASSPGLLRRVLVWGGQTRGTRIVFSFLAVLVAFSVYRVIAVPLIEPSLSTRSGEPTSEAEIASARQRIRNKLSDLAPYFAEGEWERENPMILESQRAKLLLKKYHNLGDGQVELVPCTIVFYPSEEAKESEQRVIILQAERALLKFDRDINLARGDLGQVVGGEIRGEIRIRGISPEPSAGDELLVVTRDVVLDENQISTNETVDFRFGANSGRGRKLKIALHPNDKPAGASGGPNVGGVDYLELVEDVQMQLQPGEGGLLPGDGEAPATAQVVQPPVDVRCRGPFRFDLRANVASFHDAVSVLRPNASGPADQLNCELLTIHFARDVAKSGLPAEADKQDNPSGLQPQRLVAQGNPVVIHAPSSGGHARGNRLEYDIPTRRVTLEGADEAMLKQKFNHIQARRILYTPPADGQLGELMASGPGEFRGELSGQPIEASWRNELSLRPVQQSHVLSMNGAGRLKFADRGELRAREIHFWLKQQPDAAEPGKMRATPDRMMALGDVQLSSPQLVGKTDQLELWFKQRPAPPGSPVAASGSGVPGRAPSGTPAMPAAFAASAAMDQRFEITGKLLRVQLAMLGSLTQVEMVSVQENVEFKQIAAAGEVAPLIVKGKSLELRDASRPELSVVVQGQPASVDARGMKLLGASIQLSRAANRLWINGPGQMALPVDQDVQGRTLAQGGVLTVYWQEGMNFDGRTADYRGSVVVQGDAQRLETRHLQVALRERVDFAQARGGMRPEVEVLACRDGFVLQNRQIEQGQVQSVERMEARNLSISQASGAIRADGPGWLTRTGRGTVQAVGGPRVQTASTVATPVEREGLNYLHVSFQEGLTGNLKQREMTFHRQVHTVYGPVASWEDRIDADLKGPGPSDVLLNCDHLTVLQTAEVGAQAGSMELAANGNALVELEKFTARASRITYAQAKELLVMEGDGRSAVQLFSQQSSAGVPSQAGKISFWRRTGELKVDDARSVFLLQ